MNVLYIATRAPYGRMHGHKMGMRTYIKSLQGLGHTVVVAAFAVPGDPVDREDLGCVTRYLKLPSRAAIATTVATQFTTGRKTLNECLYTDPAVQDQIDALVGEFQVDFVIADMLRTAAYADATGLPWFLDHEDLLSERYEMWAGRSSGDENILGYLENTIPAPARGLARGAFRRALRRESRLLDRRELFWTDRALACSLRSMEETRRLQTRTRRPVFCMPVSVPIPERAATQLQQRPMTAVFTGGLTYQPNLDALRHYVEQIIPAFERDGGTAPPLRIIGACPDALRKGLDHPSLTFLGYVPDVNVEVCSAQVFFAPIVSGTGIKTKVLEALACGVPVLALPMGLTGLQGEDGVHYIGATDADDFVRRFRWLEDHPAEAERIGAAGRELAIATYSFDAATRVLGRAFERALAGQPGSAGEAKAPARADAAPTISVVTVTFNNREEFRRTAESVIGQQGAAWEWIVVDGGSSDGTPEVMAELSDHIAWGVSEPDGGIFNGMNKGLARATGDYVIFMNSGDRFASPTTLREVCDAIEATGGRPAMVCGHTRFELSTDFSYVQPTRDVDYLSHSLPTSHQSMFFRTDLHQQTPFNEDLEIAADYDAICRMYRVDRSAAYVPGVIANVWRGLESNSLKRPIANIVDMARVQRQVMEASWPTIARSVVKRTLPVAAFRLMRYPPTSHLAQRLITTLRPRRRPAERPAA